MRIKKFVRTGIFSVLLIASISVQAPNAFAQSSTPWGVLGEFGNTGVAIGVMMGVIDLDSDTDLETNFDAPVTSGESQTSGVIGIDGRILTQQQVASIAQQKIIYQIVFGGQVWIDASDEQIDLTFDKHPTPGPDTWLMVENQWSALLYTGVQVKNFLFPGINATVYFGPELSVKKIVLKTDESGGGGNAERFESEKTDWSFTLGGELETLLPGTQNVSVFAGGAVINPVGDIDLVGQSGLGLQYHATHEADTSYRAYIGMRVNY